MAIDWETGRELPEVPDQTVPTVPTPSSLFSPQERDAAGQAFRSHVTRLGNPAKVSDSDYGTALSMYEQNRGKQENHGDAVNHAITALKWDDPSFWQTASAPT